MSLWEDFKNLTFENFVWDIEDIVSGRRYRLTLSEILSKYSNVFSYLEEIEKLVLKICAFKVDSKDLNIYLVRLKNMIKYVILKLFWFVVSGYDYIAYIAWLKDTQDLEFYNNAQNKIVEILTSYYLIDLLAQLFWEDSQGFDFKDIELNIMNFFKKVYGRNFELKEFKFIHFLKIKDISKKINKFIDEFINEAISAEEIYWIKEILLEIMDFVFELKRSYFQEYERFDTE